MSDHFGIAFVTLLLILPPYLCGWFAGRAHERRSPGEDSP